MTGATTEPERPARDEPREFNDPTPAWRFRLLCGLVFVALFAGAYFPFATSPRLLRFTLWPCGLMLFLVVGTQSGLIERLMKKHTRVVVDDGGLTIGRRSVDWSQVRRVKMRVWGPAGSLTAERDGRKRTFGLP